MSPSGIAGSQSARSRSAMASAAPRRHRPQRLPQGLLSNAIAAAALPKPGRGVKQPGHRQRGGRHRQPRQRESCRRAPWRLVRSASAQPDEEVQHRQRGARSAESGRQRGRDAVAERSLTANLAIAPPVNGRPPRPGTAPAPAASTGRRRPAPVGRDDAHGEEQCAFHQHVVRGVEGGEQCAPAVAGRQPEAEHRHDHAHLADARIGEHGLRVASA